MVKGPSKISYEIYFFGIILGENLLYYPIFSGNIGINDANTIMEVVIHSDTILFNL